MTSQEVELMTRQLTYKSEPFSLRRIICWVFGHDLVDEYTREGLPVFPIYGHTCNGEFYDRMPLGLPPFGYLRSPDGVHKCNRCGEKIYGFYK